MRDFRSFGQPDWVGWALILWLLMTRRVAKKWVILEAMEGRKSAKNGPKQVGTVGVFGLIKQGRTKVEVGLPGGRFRVFFGRLIVVNILVEKGLCNHNSS